MVIEKCISIFKRKLVEKALTEALLSQLHNEDIAGNDGPIERTINRLKDKNDRCLFDRFTTEVRSLM